MERKLGEIFTYKDKTYQIVPREKENCCIGCAFDLGKYACKKPRNESRNNFGHCYFQFREDKKGIIFKEINNIEIKNNQLTINIPKGMEIDIENSDLAKGIVKFKKKDITYTEICNALDYKYYVDLSVPKTYRSKLSAISQLMSIANYFNGDWKPNWNNHNETKYTIKYDHCRDNFYVDSTLHFTSDGCVYFKNRDSVESIINNPNFKWILNTIYKN